MSRASWLNYFYLAHLSQPKADRQLYRLVKRNKIRRVFELGVEDLHRTWRLLCVAERYSQGETVKYAALDEFDARPGELDKLSLIETHRTLQTTAATVRLVPGPPTATLAGVANSHLGTDMLLIASRYGDDQLAEAWTWIPRMLQESSIIVRMAAGTDGNRRHQLLSPAEVSHRAAESTRRAAA